jgi:putative transposon-encoded protein
MKLRVVLDNSEILEKIPTKFGNSAHISISKNFIGRKVKIFTGNSKKVKNELIIDFFNSEILERKIKSFGTGAHIILPKQYSNKKVKIIIGGKNE